MTKQATQADTRRITQAQARAAYSATSIDDGDRLITDREVSRLLGASRSWPWKLVRDGRFPQPIRLSARCTRWRLSDVRAYMADPQGWVASMGA
ncbi:AlpA family phage regulatory protein [Castellaniella sp. MT123]|uniref:helix-turn-helix transcriptional regulator n=1 Tax=Castellaniella sp. MT123 TaxID=3140381 RepID=UPI0031F45562